MKAMAYSMVAGKLRKRILACQIQPDSKLPSERDLCREMSVSRITVRHAMRILQSEGLITCRHGSGYYVKPHPERRIPLVIDYTGSMRTHAPTLRRRVLSHAWVAPGSDILDMLGLPPGTSVLCAERLDRHEGMPVAFDRTYISPDFGRRLGPADLAHVDFIESWTARSSFRMGSCEQTVEAVDADPHQARLLQVNAGTPLLKSMELYVAADSRPAGVFVSYYHPKHICIRSFFHWRNR